MDALDLSFALSPLSASYVRTALRLTHFAGLVLGLGGAVFLDLILCRHRRTAITAEIVANVEWISRFVAGGLAMLWISGIGFLLLYQATEPDKVQNPKIWAKIIIVAILTLNGLAIHRLVLPFLRERIGSPLLSGLQPTKRTALIACGAISGVSWTIPVVLGAAPQLNFVVPCSVILAAYLVVLAQAFLFGTIAMRERREPAPLSSSGMPD
ncbi:MAG: hypothetical protein E5Y52_11400 [Mesorhizobium sp.]|nr:MAG: hypothetical protein E5Y52_11400 [Mesorhizobium sp.]